MWSLGDGQVLEFDTSEEASMSEGTRIVMTLLARNEADVVDAQIAFHLSAGVDLIVATDNRSEDGTLEILERWERTGRVHLIREPSDDMRQAEWVTSMARFAATELEADWVINSDADEFWWPRGGTLKEVFETIPVRFGAVRGCWRHFVPRPEGEADFAERMTVRLCEPAFPGDKRTIFHAHQKVAHRARADVEIEVGNHNAYGTGLEPFRAWHPIEVLHFSIRSAAQLKSKSRGGWSRRPDDNPPLHLIRMTVAQAAGELDAFYASHVVDDDALERGLAEGGLAIDTRLRDALRLLRGPGGSFDIPCVGAPSRLVFPMPDVAESGAYAAEASSLVEVDGIVRSEARIAALERRLDSVETSSLRKGLAVRASGLIPRRRLARP